MKTVLMSFGLALAIAFVAAEDSLCACNRMYYPVCGSNGVTYANPCLFQCAKKTKPEIKIEHTNKCNDFSVGGQPCVCNRMLYPVCGSDGQTYSNPCMLKCAAQKRSGLEQVHYGACEQNLKADTCICTKELFPVCGTDGESYANPCLLRCAAKKNSALTVLHTGFCVKTNLVQQAPCICTDDYTPVCGSNGVTYPNLCGLNCAKRTKPELAVDRQGECPKFSVGGQPCVCDRMLYPVCGSDGQTYSNPCMLKCAAQKRSGLEQVHYGACEQKLMGEMPCFCTFDYTPVCGSDGVTYPNLCTMKCEQRKKSDLYEVYQGECNHAIN